MDLLERSSLLTELGGLLAAAGAGGRVALAAGAAGIGKSAVVRQFGERQAAGTRFLLGACDPLLTSRTLGPLHDFARQTGGPLAGLMVLALVAALAWLLQRRLIYFPDRSAPPPASQVIAGAQDVTLRTVDGLSLGAWLVRPPPGTPDLRLAVLVAPGNAGTGAAGPRSPRPWPARA